MAPTVSSRMTPSTVCILTELTLIYEGFENAIHRTGMDGWVCAHSCELLLAHTNGESPERFWCDVFFFVLQCGLHDLDALFIESAAAPIYAETRFRQQGTTDHLYHSQHGVITLLLHRPTDSHT